MVGQLSGGTVHRRLMRADVFQELKAESGMGLRHGTATRQQCNHVWGYSSYDDVQTCQQKLDAA